MGNREANRRAEQYHHTWKCELNELTGSKREHPHDRLPKRADYQGEGRQVERRRDWETNDRPRAEKVCDWVIGAVPEKTHIKVE